MAKRQRERRSISEEDLHAYLDGALEAERRDEVAVAIASDPSLSSKLRAYEAQRKGLHGIYDHILSEPIPQRLLDILKKRSDG